MTSFREVTIGEFFLPVNGKPKFIRDYMDAHPGEYPVYSASLLRPFGFVNEFEYDGSFLTWVMNGYGGRVQEVSGRFSANRDRGVFIPREGLRIPDLTFLRFAMEPGLTAAAVGRRVDGRLNEYTKIYPDAASQISMRMPLTSFGEFDYERMSELGDRFRRIERAQIELRRTEDALTRAVFPFDVPAPSEMVSLADEELFSISIGKRVVSSQLIEAGIPVYSANSRTPMGKVSDSNISDFSHPSLLWGIDGVFDWNLLPASEAFAHTDHCGRLQIRHPDIDPEYVYLFLRHTRERYGFDRVYRSSLENVKAEVTIILPSGEETARFDMVRQRALANQLRSLEKSRLDSLAALQDTVKARVQALL